MLKKSEISIVQAQLEEPIFLIDEPKGSSIIMLFFYTATFIIPRFFDKFSKYAMRCMEMDCV